MPNLKETRDRISSIASITKITSAMKMVSASKLKKSQNLKAHLYLYFEHLEGIYKRLGVVIIEKKINQAFDKSQIKLSKRVLLIVIGSNRGLCGSFNNSIAKEIERISKETPNSQIELLTIGKKINTILSKNFTVYKDKSELLDQISLGVCNKLIEDLKVKYKSGLFQSIKLIYNYPKSTSIREVKYKDLFSLDLDKICLNSSSDYICEPSKSKVFEQLKDQIKKLTLYKALIESSTAEHAARMMAMHKATENATELKAEISLTYNKVRQASITKEITEISSQI